VDPHRDHVRSQRRVEASIPIQVRGLDSTGTGYEDETTALEVSRRGLSFIAWHDLPIFASVTVVIPGRGPLRSGEGPSDFFTEATVVRCTREPDESFRVAVRFRGASFPIYSAEIS
jgi:hypothetical protein